MDLRLHIESFFELVGAGRGEIYNEFSLQHELGIHLRSHIPEADLKVQFERPVSYFFPAMKRLGKKEIDIAVFDSGRQERSAIELKFPRNGQHPEQMFKACQDIAFLEELVALGFRTSYFVMVVDDHLFYQGTDSEGIYPYFRNQKPLQGTISKPTGAKDQNGNIRSNYQVVWKPSGAFRYAIVPVIGIALLPQSRSG